MAVRILVAALLVASSAFASASNVGGVRKILQSTSPDAGASATITPDSTRFDAITITPAVPYPQTGIFCNVTGDSRIPSAGAVFPLTLRVPVGVEALVVFANVTGTIPGDSTSGDGDCSSVVQQPGTSVVQQPGTSVVQQPGTSVVQQPGTSVVQQPGSSVVQQPGGSSVVQQPGTGTPGVVQPGTKNCQTSVLQQPTSVVQQPTSVVQQQQQQQPPSSVVQQPPSSVVQQPPSSVVQQPPSSVVQQPPSSVVQQPPSSVVQQPPSSVVQQPPSSVVQQPPSSVVQQPPSGGGVVQQPPSGGGVVQQGRRLLQTPAPIEFISNNGSTGQPELSVTDTTEGVPNIRFKPTAAGQTASFSGALQVAVTTTNDGFGTPFIPYQVDARLSPNCGVEVTFIAV